MKFQGRWALKKTKDAMAIGDYYCAVDVLVYAQSNAFVVAGQKVLGGDYYPSVVLAVVAVVTKFFAYNIE